MESDGDVGVLQVSPAVHVELADGVHVKSRAKRLVQEFDGSDTGVVAEVVTELVEGFDGQGNGVTLSPLRSGGQLTGVVETVLRSGSAVQVEHHLEAMLASPANRLSNVIVCAVHEWLAAND